MNELTAKTMYTTKEVAEQLRTSAKVILENAKKCLPDKIIENGKPTYWTKEEITILIEYLKGNNPNQHSFTGAVKAISTELTPALRIRNAMLEMQSAYEDELARLRAENEEKEKQLIEQAPKIDFYNCVTGSKDTMDMKEVAKVLNYATLGRNNLFELLRLANVLDRNNLPYQKYVDAGYFRIIESRYTMPDGETKISLKTVVFQRGIDFIRNVINRNLQAFEKRSKE